MNQFSPLQSRAAPLLEVFHLHSFPSLAEARPQILRGLKQVEEPLPPPQQRRQSVLLIRLGIEEVVKELVPNLIETILIIIRIELLHPSP